MEMRRSPAVTGPYASTGGTRPAQAPAARNGKADDAVPRLRVMLGDADPLARRVVRDVLEASEGFVVVAEARDGVELVELALHYRPDIVLMELALPRRDGVEVARRITAAAPEIRVVVFAVAHDPEMELRALRAGANGFIYKDMQVTSLTQALRGVMRGEAAISRSLTMRLIERLRAIPEAGTGMRPVLSPLTTREWEVLDLLTAGRSTAQIAESLVLAEDTVYSHIKNIMRKLKVHSRSAAVEAARNLCKPMSRSDPPVSADQSTPHAA